MNNNDKISIIIPVYQAEKYLERCLNSVINQTYKNLEIILIDDGSTDLSSSICDEYKAKDERIVVLHQNHQGVSVARNSGLDLVTGEYIGFVDSDDWIELNMYEEMYGAIVKQCADIVVTGHFLETRGESKAVHISGEKYCSAEKLLEGAILDRNGSVTAIWSKLYKKEKFAGVRFVPDVYYCEDSNCLVDLMREKPKIGFLGACHYHYNNSNEQSLTRDTTAQVEYGNFIFYQNCLSLPKEFLMNEVVLRRIRTKILKKAVRCYMLNQNMSQIDKCKIKQINDYLMDDKNYRGIDRFELKTRILCYFYRNCKNVLNVYARIRYGR